MPLTKKGNKIMEHMRSEYGARKGTSVFYASRNAGRISGVDPESSGHKPDAAKHAHRRLIQHRRTLEDHMREQEDALLGEAEPDTADPHEADEHESGKRGKLGKHASKDNRY